MRSHLVFLALVVGCGFNETPKPDPKPTPGGPTGVLGGEAISADNAPPPISGGTLLISAVTSNTAFTSNPDLGQVDVVRWTNASSYTSGTASVLWTADVGAGSEPGRIAEDKTGRVYVVLRQKGQIAQLDVAAKTVTFRDVCPAPRGINASGDSVLVACAGGELMSLPFDSGDAKLVQQLDSDLRDIVTANGNTYVTRFRSAEVLTLGSTVARTTPWVAEDHVPDPDFTKAGTIIEYARYTPEVAWRTVPGPDGSLYSVHHYATTRTVPTLRNPQRPVPYYGGAPGGASSCFSGGGVVLTAVTRYQNGRPTGTVALQFSSPAVDVAVAPNGDVAIATVGRPGSIDTGGYAGSGSTLPPSVVVIPAATFNSETPVCLNQLDRRTVSSGEPVAVAYTKSGNLIVQTREPSQLVSPISLTTYGGTGNATPIFATVRLSNTVHDSGFTMFHEPTSSNIACMSCHPEGGEDGHTWHFDLGFRRTQSIRGGILSTAPFHWSGDEANMIQLSHDVFSERMGGGTMTDAQTNVLGKWVNRIPAIPARGTLDVAAVVRGQAVFAKADCASCHSGERFTSNENKDVGTGAKFQVPSLLGVASRGPYMHDGCAPSLMARFTDTKCGGGDNHGKLAGLGAQDLSDLVSYVESL